ncbi:MAG TPA: tetratricopeptide repeat protein [Polyangiaceae bacterium]
MRPSDRTIRSILAVSALSLVALATPLASAAGADPSTATAAQKKEAMDHFTAGKQALETKNYEKAVAELRASLDVVDSPNARLELARALRDAGKLADAWTEYERVVQDATKLAAKEERYAKTADAATTERTDVEAKLAFVIVTVAHAPADGVLKVGGKTVPQDQWVEPIVAPAGAVDVVLTDASGKELARQTVMAAVGQKLPVDLDAQPAPAPAAPHEVAAEDKPDMGPAPSDTTPPPASSGRAGLRPWAYVAGGVGVAGLAAFTIFGLMANSNFSDLQNSCHPLSACPSSKSGEIDSGKTDQIIANIGLGVGIVGVAAGATLFVLSLGGKSAPAASTGLVVGPSFVGVRGTL